MYAVLFDGIFSGFVVFNYGNLLISDIPNQFGSFSTASFV